MITLLNPSLNRARTGRKARRTGFLGRLLKLHAIWRERRALAALDEARLRDLGLSKDKACREARRGAWDAPERWLR